MKYPKAGDLQRAMSTEISGNPTENPWEVRSASGLEGVFADGDEAEGYADELRRSGATKVTARRVVKRTLTPQHHTQNPSEVLREKWGTHTTIAIERNTHGYTGWLVGSGGTRLPISFGHHKPTNAREALALAKRFLSGVHGKNNPSSAGTEEIKLKDRHSGGHVWLTLRDGIVVGVMGSDPKRYLGMSLERAMHVARHGGSGASKNPDEDTFDTDILDGMARAIWVTSWASWVEEMSKEEREEHDVPVRLSGINWEDAAPSTPDSADEAARDLYVLIERANGKNIGELFQKACQVDGCKRNEKNAELFGHYLAMQGMGHGVSWFDEHKEFPLKFPRGFEAHTFDGGEEVEWSPRVRSTQNGGSR